MVKNLLICFITMLLVSCGSSSQRKSDIGESDTQESSTTVEPTEKAEDYQFLVKVGDIAPDFEMQMPDGSIVNLSSLRGKVVMLQFTASWCGVCRKEMPFIEKDIWLKHKDNKAFALFGVDRDEPLETVVAFAKRTGVTYPLALDPGADIFARYADRKAGITRNVLIDKAGKIVMLTRLYNEEEFSSLCKKIDEMLGEK